MKTINSPRYIRHRRRRLVWIILSSIAVLIVLAIIIPITIVFTKKTDVNITRTMITASTIITTTTKGIDF
jgi:maltodextrin utilization protein YvdJ